MKTAMEIAPIVDIENGEVKISGRQLHMFLAVQTPYAKWFDRMTEYGFMEGVDFNLDKNVQVQNEGGRDVKRELIDHIMTLSTAKELAMLQRTDKGKEARRYFIRKQNGVDMGQNRLFQWMRENGYLVSRQGTDYNMPTQKSMERGLFTIKETAVTHADGHTSISKTPKVTGKGQVYFVNKFAVGA